MNAILMEYGMEPLVFLSDAEYTDATQEDHRMEGSFTNFLKRALPKMDKVKKTLEPK